MRPHASGCVILSRKTFLPNCARTGRAACPDGAKKISIKCAQQREQRARPVAYQKVHPNTPTITVSVCAPQARPMVAACCHARTRNRVVLFPAPSFCRGHASLCCSVQTAADDLCGVFAGIRRTLDSNADARNRDGPVVGAALKRGSSSGERWISKMSLRSAAAPGVVCPTCLAMVSSEGRHMSAAPSSTTSCPPPNTTTEPRSGR